MASGQGLDRDLELYGFDVRKGARRQRETFPRNRVHVLDGVIYAGDMSFGADSSDPADDLPMRHILRLDLRTARPLSSLPLPRSLWGHGYLAAVAPGVLLVQNQDQDNRQVSAIDPRSGVVLWTSPTRLIEDRGLAECDVAGVESPRLVYLCGPQAGTVTAHDLRTGAVVAKPLKLGVASLGPVASGRSVEWSQGNGDEVDRVGTRDLATGRMLDEVSAIGFRPAVVWPRGGWDEAERPGVVWTADRKPVLLGIGCATDGLGRPGEPSACTKPRLLAFNR